MKKFELEAEKRYSLQEMPTYFKVTPGEQVDFLLKSCTGEKNWPKFFHSKTILEVGAGECSFLPRFLEVSAPHKYVASDVFKERMEIAKNNIKNSAVEFCAANVLCLPFPRMEFDSILAFGLLHHIPNLEDAIGEIARVLKPGGLFIFRDPWVGNPAIWLKYRFGQKSDNEFPLSGRRIAQALKARGLKLVFVNRFWLRFPWLPSGPWSVNIGGTACKTRA